MVQPELRGYVVAEQAGVEGVEARDQPDPERGGDECPRATLDRDGIDRRASGSARSAVAKASRSRSPNATVRREAGSSRPETLDPVPREELLHQPFLVWPRSLNPPLVDHVHRMILGRREHPRAIEIPDIGMWFDDQVSRAVPGFIELAHEVAGSAPVAEDAQMARQGS